MRYNYNKLWKMLIDKGLNKRELSHLSGISESTLSRMKRGGQVGISILIRLKDALGCDFEELFEVCDDGAQNGTDKAN